MKARSTSPKFEQLESWLLHTWQVTPFAFVDYCHLYEISSLACSISPLDLKWNISVVIREIGVEVH